MLANFLELNKKYKSIRDKFANSFDELSINVSQKQNHYIYSKGGLLLHRGYFSPSMLDIMGILGGVSRGRLINDKNNADYEYIFDAENRLICCKKYSNENNIKALIETEFLIYDEDNVLSLIFNHFQGELYFISECFFTDGNQQKYQTAIFYNDDIEINIEELEFSKGNINSLLYSRYLSGSNFFDQEKYNFS